MALTKQELSTRMSKRLASFNLSDAVVSSIADRVLIDGLSIGRWNPCIYGICIDYWTDKAPNLDRLLTYKSGARKWEVFPYGILEWDRFLVRVGFGVDELEGRVSGHGFEH